MNIHVPQTYSTMVELNNIANIRNIINTSGIKDYQNINWNIFKHIELDSKFDYFKINKLQFPIIGNNESDVIHIVLKSNISQIDFWDVMIQILLERFLIYNPKTEEDKKKFKDKKVASNITSLLKSVSGKSSVKVDKTTNKTKTEKQKERDNDHKESLINLILNQRRKIKPHRYISKPLYNNQNEIVQYTFYPRESELSSDYKSEDILYLESELTHLLDQIREKESKIDKLSRDKLLYNKTKNDDLNEINDYFQFKLATVLRDKNEEFIPKKSSLNDKHSNIFGSLHGQFNQKFNLEYNFSIDNDYSTFEYNDINATLSFDKFVTQLRFVEENNIDGGTNVITNSFTYNHDEENSFSFNTRRNRKIDLTEYYDLVYEYKNDCLIAGIKYKKTYYEDRDLKPSENLFFSISI